MFCLHFPTPSKFCGPRPTKFSQADPGLYYMRKSLGIKVFWGIYFLDFFP
jgi:hypothetical protein